MTSLSTCGLLESSSTFCCAATLHSMQTTHLLSSRRSWMSSKSPLAFFYFCFVLCVFLKKFFFLLCLGMTLMILLGMTCRRRQSTSSATCWSRTLKVELTRNFSSIFFGFFFFFSFSWVSDLFFSAERYTAEQCRNHPWVLGDKASDKPLNPRLDKLAEHNAERKAEMAAAASEQK